MRHPADAKGFKAERFENGACVAFDPLIGKYVGVDCEGGDVGYKRNLDDARALARSLEGKPYVHPEPAPISVSPRAHPSVRDRGGERGGPAAEHATEHRPADAGPEEFLKMAPTRRKPAVVEGYAGGKALT